MIRMVGAFERPVLGVQATAGLSLGAAVKAARLEAGLTVEQLVARVQSVDQRRGLPALDPENLRTQIFKIEANRQHPGQKWRSRLSEALRVPSVQLFGPIASVPLPPPLLADTRVTDATVQNLLARRANYAEAEHIFGPAYVVNQVRAELHVVRDLIELTPALLRRDMRLAAAHYAELLGWIAQESGDLALADSATREAVDHLELVGGEPGLRAMLLMRRSNVLTATQPRTATEFAEAAATLAAGIPTARLHGAIARQHALAAFAVRDESAFKRHVEIAYDLASAEPDDNDLAKYASPAYIVSETAPGLIAFRQADLAADRLQEHLDKWPDGQHRDQTVSQMRFVHALVAVGDYTAAYRHVDDALRGLRATPSARGHDELVSIAKLLRDRGRTHDSLPLTRLRGQIKDALSGGKHD